MGNLLPYSLEAGAAKDVQDGKMPPLERTAQRVTAKDIEDIRSSAWMNGDRYMLALTYVMEQLSDILRLLEQQNQPSNSGNYGCNGANDGEHQ